MSRYSQVFEPAKKSEKLEHVRLFNDEMASGFVKVQRGSPLAMEYASLPKDPDWDANSGKPPSEDPRFPNHCTDAALYSWRRALPHLDYTGAVKAETNDERLERLDEERLTQGGGNDWWDDGDFGELD